MEQEFNNEYLRNEVYYARQTQTLQNLELQKMENALQHAEKVFEETLRDTTKLRHQIPAESKKILNTFH